MAVRRAGLLHLRRGPGDVRVGGARERAGGARRPCSRSSRTAALELRTPGSSRSTPPARGCCGVTRTAPQSMLSQLARRRDRQRASARRCSGPGAATAGSMSRRWPRSRAPPPSAQRAELAGGGRAVARAVCRRRRARRAAAGDRTRGVQLPGTARAAHRGCAAVGARALPRADRGVQGLRRALPRRPRSAACVRGPGGRSRSWSRPPATPAARWRRPFTGGRASRVVVLFPKGRVSPTQEQQLTCWGGNVRAFAVRGTFDDCQRMVKEAFRRRRRCAPACSCPRPTASTSGACCRRRCTTRPRALRYGAARRAGIVHRAERQPRQRGGLPVGAPHGAADRRGRARPQRQPRRAGLSRRAGTGSRAPSVATLASAMDVGNPSNMERLRALFPQFDRAAGRRERLLGERRADPRAHPHRLRAVRPGLVPAYGHRGGGLRAAARRRCAPSAAGCWWRRRIRPSSRKSSSP